MASEAFDLTNPADRPKARVSYFYDPDVGSYYYGPQHPMKPQRIRMAHSLILSYDLYKHMEVFKPHRALDVELAYFHDPDYVNFLATVTADNYREYANQLRRFNIGETTDCPVFSGLFEFQQSCAGASIDAAHRLNSGSADICINWSGGLHHAKRGEASGFCYMNDIVLAILELLKYHARVMYIDIDIHHGDGVEEAFYTTHRVMTVSFHKFGDFFPGTGDVTDVGAYAGKYYAVNVPLDNGCDDETFLRLFKPIISKCVEVYRPGAIVIQCGADSVAGDRLGRFNLTIKGHAECVRFCKSLGLPLLVLGGGGYTIRNVSRTWTYETAVVLDKEVSNQLPLNEYHEYYQPDYFLHLPPSNMPNLNTPDQCARLLSRILRNLSTLEHAPGVHFAHVPPDVFTSEADVADAEALIVGCEGGGIAAGAERSSALPKRPGSSIDEQFDPSGEGGVKLRRVDYTNELDEDDDPDQKAVRATLMMEDPQLGREGKKDATAGVNEAIDDSRAEDTEADDQRKINSETAPVKSKISPPRSPSEVPAAT